MTCFNGLLLFQKADPLQKRLHIDEDDVDDNLLMQDAESEVVQPARTGSILRTCDFSRGCLSIIVLLAGPISISY